MTNKEKVISFLKEKRGAVEVKSRSSKYVKLVTEIWGFKESYFVGSHGGVRKGENIKESSSVTDGMYKIMRYNEIDI